MIAHIVLFRPKPGLSAEAAQRVLSALSVALAGVPTVRRSSIGRRVMIGRGYEQRMRSDYPYAAVLEFDDISGLKDYLSHPLHDEVGGAVFDAAEDLLVYDFEMSDGSGDLATIVPT